jgi:hypothetical protein
MAAFALVLSLPIAVVVVFLGRWLRLRALGVLITLVLGITLTACGGGSTSKPHARPKPPVAENASSRVAMLRDRLQQAGYSVEPVKTLSSQHAVFFARSETLEPGAELGREVEVTVEDQEELMAQAQGLGGLGATGRLAWKAVNGDMYVEGGGAEHKVSQAWVDRTAAIAEGKGEG